MTWRGSTTIRDRIFASLPYLLPLMDALVFGASLFNVFPALQLVFVPLLPLLFIYNSFGGFTSLIIFFALFLLVVRNERINHFIRFNTMQALLLDITLVLARLILRVLQVGGAGLCFEGDCQCDFPGGFSSGDLFCGAIAPRALRRNSHPFGCGVYAGALGRRS